MSSVEELRAQVAMANDRLSEALGQAQAVYSNLEQASGTIQQVMQGSAMADWSEGHGAILLALDATRTAQETTSVAIQSLEGIANRL